MRKRIIFTIAVDVEEEDLHSCPDPFTLAKEIRDHLQNCWLCSVSVWENRPHFLANGSVLDSR